MKWLFNLIMAVVMVTPAFAGEDPYIAIVGTDCVALGTNSYGQVCNAGFISFADPFYFSPKYRQFMYNEYLFPFDIPTAFSSFPPVNQYTRAGGTGTEQFRSQTPNNLVEICDTTTAARGLKSAKTPASNAGFYEWFILVPKKPSGEINIVIQCGVVKPGAATVYGYDAIEICAAETGERIGAGVCVRDEVYPGINPVMQTALPKITAIAYPGAYNVAFAPFNLTAFRNPGIYHFAGPMRNDQTTQILNGTDAGTKILLKPCMDETVVTKLPVTGQLNAASQQETDLEAGDMIYVRMDVPRQNTVDIYCHAQSAKIMGIGESPY